MESFQETQELLLEQGLEITDTLSPEDEAFDGVSWSISGRSPAGCRISFDEGVDGLQMNTFFVETPPYEISSLEEYREAHAYAEDRIRLSVTSEDGIFMRAKHSADPKMDDVTDEELVEAVLEKDMAMSVQLVYCDRHQEMTEDEILDSIGEMDTYKNELHSLLN